eukprot:4664710-Amphidinium_carterae.1
MRTVLSWASEQDVEITEADVTNRFGAAGAADQIEDVLARACQLYCNSLLPRRRSTYYGTLLWEQG